MKKILSLALLSLSVTPLFAAEPAGQVGYMSGTLAVQRGGETIMLLAPKSPVLEGDVLVTSKGGYAQVQMRDGTQMTLRPESNLKIEAFRFKQDAPKEDNAIFRLLKGGLRTVSGLIGKRGNQDAYQLRAKTATIGIRGTDFTARLCGSKACQAASAESVKPQVHAPQAVGQVMLMQGGMAAKDPSGKVRKLSLGSRVYEGDTLDTDIKSHAVVAFRDESRITLQESTSFFVERFKYDKASAQESAVMQLLKGGVRVVTGLVGRVKHENFKFKVATATIGIRGTGFDSWCRGDCAEGGNPGATINQPLEGAGVYVWSGAVELVTPNGSVDVGLLQAAIIDRSTGKAVPVAVVPKSIIENGSPRPDSVPANMDKEVNTEPDAEDTGVYVTVNHGQVIVNQGDKSLNLSTGETGLATTTNLMRLPERPAFMGVETNQLDTGNNTNPSVNPQGCVIVF